MDLQPLWPYSVKKPDFSDLGCSSRHVISKTKSVTPLIFYISDITNSSTFNGKILRKKSMLENFRANVLKVKLKEIILPSKHLYYFLTAYQRFKNYNHVNIVTTKQIALPGSKKLHLNRDLKYVSTRQFYFDQPTKNLYQQHWHLFQL